MYLGILISFIVFIVNAQLALYILLVSSNMGSQNSDVIPDQITFYFCTTLKTSISQMLDFKT